MLKIEKGKVFDHQSFTKLVGSKGAVLKQSENYVEAIVPLSVLDQIGGIKNMDWVRGPHKPKLLANGLGSVVSQSVPLLGAQGYQNSGVTGSGLKVAVIDAGFGGLSEAQSNGEIPANAIEVNVAGGFLLMVMMGVGSMIL